MSEYQYFEWQTVDRLLTEAEQEDVSDLSSHIDVSSSRAVVTYAYGSFKHDPRKVLARFFDAHLYLANWGSRCLMFRFPSGLVNGNMIVPYCIQDRITFRTMNAFDVLDMDLSEEEGGGWIDDDGSLSGLISLRNDILQGDYRSVYLAWLKVMSVQDGYLPRRRKSRAQTPMAPAIPAGLKQLTPALRRFVEQFDIPTSLLEAAAEHSPELAQTVTMDFKPLVAKLTREQCDRFLCRLAQGDATVSMELKKQLHAMEPCPQSFAGPGRSIDELLKRADAIESARKRREEREARRKHEAEMKDLADRETATWQQVDSLVALKQTKSYDDAIRLLAKLAQLAEFRGSQEDYRLRVNDLCERYKRLSGFRLRVQRANLLDEPEHED